MNLPGNSFLFFFGAITNVSSSTYIHSQKTGKNIEDKQRLQMLKDKRSKSIIPNPPQPNFAVN